MVAPDPSTLPVPPGYKLRFEVTGESAPAFAEDPEQTVLIYARGKNDIKYPLMVAFSARTDVALIGTHGHPGSTVLLADGGGEATYHDGMWELADGAPSTSVDQFRWNDRDTHSLTVRLADGSGTVAVRGARSRDASYGGLLRLVEHLTA